MGPSRKKLVIDTDPGIGEQASIILGVGSVELSWDEDSHHTSQLQMMAWPY